MAHYHRGRALEHEIRTALRNAGFAVIRGAGSKGTFDRPCEHCGKGLKVDLVGSKRTNKSTKEVWLVLGQCKLTGASDADTRKAGDGDSV